MGVIRDWTTGGTLLVVEGCNLRGIDLRGSDLRRADLRGEDLSGSRLSFSQLHQASFRHANLRGADLAGADLSGANLTGADLRGAQLTGARLSGVIYDSRTVWPADTDPDLLGARRVGYPPAEKPPARRNWLARAREFLRSRPASHRSAGS
jgi:uncharacterized protein YjbI with pentapeptide repeats